MRVAYVILRVSLRKGRYFGRLQWYSMIKYPTAWDNIYVAEVLGMGDTIYARDRKNFMETACPTREPWFGEFMRCSKLRMGVIQKQDFRVTSEMIKTFGEGMEHRVEEGIINEEKGDIFLGCRCGDRFL